LFIKDAINLITCRGEHNETLFKDEKDYRMFLELMKKYQEQYDIKMFAYCLLPDHLHLLIEMEKPQGEEGEGRNAGISDFMRDLSNNYTKFYNNRYERKGHLFRERFKSALIEKHSHLLNMTAYIHLNPEKLGLVKDAKDYPYSTYQSYLFNDTCKDDDLDLLRGAITEALDFLGGKSYEEFVRNVPEEERERIHKKLQRGGILGSEEFIRMVKAEVEVYQSKGAAQASQVSNGKGQYRLYVLLGAIFLVLVVTAGGLFIFFVKREQKALPAQAASKAEEPMTDLAQTEWDVQLTPMQSGSAASDRITFLNGRFYSMRTGTMGFDSSNYSLTSGGGKLVFETMQTAKGGSASWHGEVKQGKMTGVVSVRQEGKEPQDFSFSSITYRRKQ
jgi:REP element-mobilizing transposase RayT